jgi:hypothetical protein
LDAEPLVALVNKHGAFVLGNTVLAGVQLSVADETRDRGVVLIIFHELLKTLGLADVAQDGGEELCAVAVRRLAGHGRGRNLIAGLRDCKHWEPLALKNATQNFARSSGVGSL